MLGSLGTAISNIILPVTDAGFKVYGLVLTKKDKIKQ